MEYPELKVRIENVSPAMATKYLEKNVSNRPLNMRQVEKYLKDMQAGKWELNGDTIAFSDQGKLINGQHRLTALSMHNMVTPFIIVEGVPDRAYATIDINKVRTAGDILSHHSITSGNQYAGVARMALAFIQGKNMFGGNNAPNMSEVVEFILTNPYLIQVSEQVRKAKAPKIGHSSLAAVLFLANRERKYDTHVDQFLHDLKTGSNLSEGDPTLTLRNWAINYNSKGHSYIARDVLFSIIAKTWNNYTKNTAMKVIQPGNVPKLSDTKIVGYVKDKAA